MVDVNRKLLFHSRALVLGHTDYVFDPMNSFLCFSAYNSDRTGVLAWSHSVNSVISKLEILHAGNILETVDNYAQLSAFY